MKSKTTRPISDSLLHFDELPNSAFIRLPVVALLFGCSGKTIWRRSKAGLLPAPRKLGPNTSAWNVGKIRRVLNKAA